MKTKILTKSKLAALLLGALIALAVIIGLSFGGNHTTASAATYPDGANAEITVEYIKSTDEILISGWATGTDSTVEQINIYITCPSGQSAYTWVFTDDTNYNGSRLTFNYRNSFTALFRQAFPNATLADGYYALEVEVGFWSLQGSDFYAPAPLKTVAVGTLAQLPPDPVQEYYDFAGWYYDSAFKQPYDGAPIYADTKLYAKFTPIVWTITYVLNGGINSAYNQFSYTIENGDEYFQPATKTGYTFINWYDNPDFTGSPWYGYGGWSTFGDLTFYAKFTPISYNVTYHADGGTLTGQATSFTIESANITYPTPHKTGYTFDGWYESAAFTGATVTGIPAGSMGDKAVYAKFTPINYTVTYNVNHGELTGETTNYTIESGAVSLPNPTRTGYAFKGWYDNADCNGAQISVIPTGSTGDKTYYAKWEILKYKVTFYVDGEVYNEMTVDYGSTLSSVYLVNPQTLEAVQLFTSADMTTAFNLDTVIAENMTIHATAGFVAYNSVTYKVNGEELATDLLDYNTPLKDLRTATLDGYTFDGWYYDTAFTRAVQPTDKLTDNITLYAKMTPIDPQAEKTWIQKWWWTFAVGGAVLVVIAIAVLVIRKKKRG